VGSEYGGNTIFDSFTPTPAPNGQVAQKDWTQDPYYYYF
jgi:hypothetical protein